MSIDFSILQGLTIPEGVVTQITDAAGNVLWSAVKKLTLTFVNTADNSCVVSHSELGRLNIDQSLTYEVSPESVLTFNFEGAWDFEDKYREKVYVNGTNVFTKSLYGGDTASYTYTITKNATITINCPKYGDGRVDITEIPEGQILFTIDGENYFADEGMTWAEWFASAYNTTGKTADDVQSISANGAAVAFSAVIVGGTAYEVGFGPALIEFHVSLNGTINTYNAEDGMTWDEFVNSEYNTTFVIIGNSLYATIESFYGSVYNNAELTSLTNINDIIIAGYTYYSTTSGSGN